METAKLAQELLTYYVNKYKDRYSSSPAINRYKDKWGFVDVIETVGYDRAIQLLDYFFKIDRKDHALQWFFFNFDVLDKNEKAEEQDRAFRKTLRERTKRLMDGN